MDVVVCKFIGRDVRSIVYVFYNSKRVFFLFFWGGENYECFYFDVLFLGVSFILFCRGGNL